MDQEQPAGGWVGRPDPPSPPASWPPHHTPPVSEPPPSAPPFGPPAGPSAAPPKFAALSPPGPPPAAGPPEQPSRARVGVVALVAGLIGALVGGGIAGGVVAAINGHDTKTIVTSSPDSSLTARPSTALSKPGDIRSILAKVEPSVVRIDVTSNPDSIDSQSGTGTGFIVDPNGIIVTNAHVANAETASAASQLVVTLSDGDSVPGRVIGEDSTQDLAVVKIDRKNLPTVQLGDSDTLQVGDAVVAIGNALGIAGSPTVTAGIVSGLGRTVHVAASETLVDAIQTDAAINPGNSGGPLVDVNGRVIGINTAIADPSSANNIGFAISVSSAKPVIEDLRAGRTPRIAFMGVKTQTVTPSVVELRHLHTNSGAYVAVVTPGTGAARAGVKRGDVMIAVDGQAVRSNDDVIRIVREHKPGDALDVILLRGNSRKTLKVTLGDLPTA
jgi:putative serine protease PepD